MIRYVVVILMFMQAFVSFGQSAVSSTMKFTEAVYDFGTIKEQDGKVSHKFVFRNSGRRPFVIENVAVSCGCTTPSYSKAPIMPGKTGEIEITFDPSGRPGEFLKEIVVTSDNRANRINIKIKGTVTPRPHTIQDDYPMELSSGLRLSTLNLNFRYVSQGANASMSTAMINTSSKSVTIGADVSPAVPYLKVSSAESLCAGCRSELTVTYDFTKGTSWGVKSNNIYLIINGVRQNIPISTSAIFVDNFTNQTQQQMENAPKAKLSMQYYNFGDVKWGMQHKYEITLTNVGGLPLIIRDVDPSKGVTTSLAGGTTIAPGGTVKIKIELDGTQIPRGRSSQSIVVVMNDPLRPMREIRLAVNSTN